MSEGNPARRLHGLLCKAAKQADSDPVRQVWARVFGISPEDLPGLWERWGDLQQLAKAAEARIRALPDDDLESLLLAFPPIQRAISFRNVDEQWSTYKHLLVGETLTRLEYCARELRSSDEGPVDPAVLKELLAEVQGLFDYVLSAELPTTLRAALLDLLDVMRSAITKYEIYGVEGLRRAITLGVGTLTLAVKADPNAQKDAALEKVAGLLVRIEGVVAPAARLQPMLQQLVGPLLGLLAGKG